MRCEPVPTTGCIRFGSETRSAFRVRAPGDLGSPRARGSGAAPQVLSVPEHAPPPPRPMSCALCLRREPCASRGRGWEPGEAPSALKCSSSQVLQLGMVGEPRAPPGEPRHQHRPGAPLLKLSGLLPSPGALPPMPRKLLGHPPLGFSPYGKSELPFMVPLSLSSVLEALL